MRSFQEKSRIYSIYIFQATKLPNLQRLQKYVDID